MTDTKTAPGSGGAPPDRVREANGKRKKGLGFLTASWEIRDASGEVQAVHERYETGGEESSKKCLWRLPGGTLKDGLKGREIASLPLYGAHELDSEAMLVIVVEGEKARNALEEALRKAGITREQVVVVGTVTGASGTPSREVLEVLRGLEVVLWPDADEPGRSHMRRVAERLQGVAALVRIYHWPEAKEKDDAADHPAVISGGEKAMDQLLDDLCGAREYEPPEPEKPEGLKGRVLIGELLRGGIEPTPQLLDGLLYEGRIHSIASGPGTGKTLLAEWMAIQIMKQALSILYIDAENGPKLIAERLQELGADIEGLDELFHYYPAEVALDRESLARLMATVEQADPALVVFDSFADLLSIAGLEENSNDDCTRWMRTVAQPIKDAGSAVLVLDHVPKNGKGPRGGGSKRAKVDVQWNLEVTQHFDRERTGEIELKHDKDRECWLPKIVRFSVGGGVFARSAGTIEEMGPPTELTTLQREVYGYIRKRGAEGAGWGDILSGTGGSKGTLSSTLKKLVRLNLIEKDNGRYYAKRTEPEKPVDTPDSQGSVRFNRGSVEPDRTGATVGVQYGSPPLRGEPTEPDAEPPHEYENTRKLLAKMDADGLVPEAVVAEFARRGSGAKINLPHYLREDTTLEILTRSVLTGLGRDPNRWRHHAALVDGAARDGRNHPDGCPCDLCADEEVRI